MRPTSLTIIGWLLIVMSAFSLISQFTMQDNPVAHQLLAQSPLPAAVHIALGVFGSLVAAISGYGILKGFNWSRYLYVGWSLIGQMIGFLTSPFMAIMLLSLLMVGVFAFFLFRPAANSWFLRSVAAAGE